MMKQNDQEAELELARCFFSPNDGIRVDRCRHESVTETVLWIFSKNIRMPQIGTVKRLDGGAEYRAKCQHEWEATRMKNGEPVARRCEKTLESALRWVASYDAAIR